MSDAIKKRGPARRDLVDIFYYYARRRAVPTARRFLAQAEATIRRLSQMPGIGTPYEPDEPHYGEVRYFPVSRFPKYLVFYRRVAEGIEILRVLHGARDIHALLAEEFAVDGKDGDTESDGADTRETES
jgi:toxin ParE1/3/4